MKDYVDLVLRKTKKAISIDRIFEKVEELISDGDNYQLSNSQKEEIMDVLDKGIASFEYIKTPNDKYIPIFKTSFKKGRFYGNRNGEGNVISIKSYTDKEGRHIVLEEKFFVTKTNTNNAIDGDIVLIDNSGNNPKVVEIIDRNLENIMGEVIRVGESYFVKPIDKKKQSLIIALEGEAIEGQRVAVNLKDKTSDNYYIGEITRVFNHKDDPDEDILWEAFKCGIDDQFSRESLKQVKFIPQKVRECDKIGRTDLTGWEIFTIDGEDTKDIDDALSLKILGNGNYLVGVHIADVSFYVPKDSALDKDAYKKGTSNYLAGRVIPMLPHELSNGICSLNPHVERLAMSCLMEVTKDGEVVNHSIIPSVIKSSIKMSYTKVNELLKDGKIADEYVEHADTLRSLNKLALILRKKRLKNGALEINKPELKLLYDEEGKVCDFSTRVQDVGENLIEEFMLLANETVDKHLVERGFPCLHRIHDRPNEERLDNYLRMLSAINIPFDHNVRDCMLIPKVLQELALHIQSTGRLSNMLATSMVRCMSRAKYSPYNIGHHGLAKEYYCHFTSPIRRYPDLTVHRIIKDCCFDKEHARDNAKKWEVKLPEIGMQSSKMEKIADEAEMQTMYLKCSEYMEKHIGEEYYGTIIGLSERSIQIQLDNMVEGKIKLRNLPSRYIYDPMLYALVSLEGKDNYYIGDKLLVKVVGASKEDKTIDFSIVKKINEMYQNDKTKTYGKQRLSRANYL